MTYQGDSHDNDSDIDCDYNKHPVCPYCGQEYNGLEDYPSHSFFLECYKCDKEFEVLPSFEVTFSTSKKS